MPSLCARRGPRFLGSRPAKALALESRLSLIERGTRQAERLRALRDRLAVSTRTRRTISYLTWTRSRAVEEVGRGKQRVAHPLRVRVEASLLSQGIDLGIWALLSWPWNSWDGGSEYVNLIMPNNFILSKAFCRHLRQK